MNATASYQHCDTPSVWRFIDEHESAFWSAVDEVATAKKAALLADDAAFNNLICEAIDWPGTTLSHDMASLFRDGKYAEWGAMVEQIGDHLAEVDAEDFAKREVSDWSRERAAAYVERWMSRPASPAKKLAT